MIIEAKNLAKIFHNGESEQKVLNGVSLSVERGEFIIIMGRSGAGKSTLLYQLGLLDHPTSGNLIIEGVDTLALSSKERTVFRLNQLGYIFQDYALVPELTAEENILLPMLMKGLNKKMARGKALDVLEKVGLAKVARHLPGQLSGGEQQRVSVARAIIGDPKIIFADEPTANLDTESSRMVIDLFKKLNDEGQTIVMVTHEEEYKGFADRVITLRDGKIISEEKNR